MKLSSVVICVQSIKAFFSLWPFSLLPCTSSVTVQRIAAARATLFFLSAKYPLKRCKLLIINQCYNMRPCILCSMYWRHYSQCDFLSLFIWFLRVERSSTRFLPVIFILPSFITFLFFVAVELKGEMFN